MNKQRKIQLKEPTSIWNKNISVDFKPLFKALGKAITHGAVLNFEELGNDAIETATSLGIETTIDEIAYKLIANSVSDAIQSLTRDSNSHLNFDCIENADYDNFGYKVDDVEIFFEKDFFSKPGQQPFLNGLVSAYSQWLLTHGVSKQNSTMISSRLPAYFVFSLSTEWRKNFVTYKKLLELQNSPFSNAEIELRGWNHYFSYLKKRISENIFDEPFSLSQIYVPLNAYYIQRQEQTEHNSSTFIQKYQKVCVNLQDELTSWIKSKDFSDALRVLSGGPGSGKSSFTRFFCSELAEKGLAKPIYIPLHLIDPTQDVTIEVERFVRDEGLLGFNPLDPDKKEAGLVLIFDGLDELASTGKVAAQVARDFIQAVERMVERRNLGSYPIHVIISGRELVVQENETEFRRPKQVLNILPYFITEDKTSFTDPRKILDNDLRQIWWKNYGMLIGENFDGVPLKLNLSEIDEITAQPLLNYLVALSYRRGKIDFNDKLDLNIVYADLVAAVHERGYEKTRTYRPISHIGLREFIRVLEEIGLAAWHGSDGRSTSVRDILRHCQQSGLTNLIDSFTEGAQAGTTKLLAAFFFRRGNESAGEDATFVFTHKSFGEYLTAMRLVRGLERIVNERCRRKANTDDGFDTIDALIHWIKLAGPAPITEYIQKFLKREIIRRSKNELDKWHEVLTELLTQTMEQRMPLEKIGNLTFINSSRQEINASTSLFISLNAVAEKLGKCTRLGFQSETSFGTFIRRICPQRSGPLSPILFSALSFLDLSGQCLDMVDLYDANLEHTVWKNSSAHFANFDRANLFSADFTGAKLNWSRFNGADINQTCFVDAFLEDANFNGANFFLKLWNVNFEGATLLNASFSNAHLENCNFKNAILIRSNLHKAKDVQRCQVEGAKIQGDDKLLGRWIDRARTSGRLFGNIQIIDEEVDPSERKKKQSPTSINN